jgi:hypothetical protein
MLGVRVHHLSFFRIDLDISSIVIGNLSWGIPERSATRGGVELDRRCIRLHDAKMQCFTAASGYFSLPLREQTLAYPKSSVFAKHL